MRERERDGCAFSGVEIVLRGERHGGNVSAMACTVPQIGGGTKSFWLGMVDAGDIMSLFLRMCERSISLFNPSEGRRGAIQEFRI